VAAAAEPGSSDVSAGAPPPASVGRLAPPVSRRPALERRQKARPAGAAREGREAPPSRRLVLVSATKGIETETLERMSEVAAAETAAAGQAMRFAVLAGPSFASELARSVPSAVVIASEDATLATEIREVLSTPFLRLYSSPDVVGVELGGASKNVIAIAAGAVSGLGLGDNTLAALITRGLHEITRLGVACGGQSRTFAGLAGLGDLVLTCTGELSRNRRAGLELAAGKTRAEIAGETHMVAEGIRNSLAIARLAALRGVEMPITEQMVAVLYQGKDPRRAVEDLMTRGLKAEAEL
jgi:glycerol-3-phosphate dehydrogenase (NAD(P)+)